MCIFFCGGGGSGDGVSMTTRVSVHVKKNEIEREKHTKDFFILEIGSHYI